MTVIELNRAKNTLKIAPTTSELKTFRCFTMIYDVTHIQRISISSVLSTKWYRIYNGIHVIGFITDVTEVKEKWE